MKKYITAQKEYSTFERHIAAPYIRKVFTIAKKPQTNCNIKIYCLGFYKLFINGNDITKGLLSPYINNPCHFTYYDEYDIKNYLSDGENVIGIILGNGFINSNDNNLWDFQKAPFRASPRVAVELFLDNNLILESDTNFKSAPSPLTFDDYRCGERYDARLEKLNWNKIGYDDSLWSNVIEAEFFGGEEKLCLAEPITCYRKIHASSIINIGDGYIFDFGENNAGIIKLFLKNTFSGQTIRLFHGEILKDGKLNIDNICFGDRSRYDYTQVDEYICKGEQEETYTPSFTYHGFRYVYVEGLKPEQANLEALTYLIYSSNIKQIGEFSCSNETVNRIFDCAMRSNRSNFYYFPTDCPQREKNGWTGDIALSAEQLIYSFDCSKSLKQWHENLIKAQLPSGQLSGIVPTGGWGYEWGNGPAWDIALIELPYRAYQFNGELWDCNKAITKYIYYMESKINEDGLLNYGLGDWCETGTLSEDSYSTPLYVTDTITGVDICYKASVLLKVLGQIAEAEKTITLRNQLINNLRKYKFKNGLLDINTQTAQAMAIYYNIYTEEEKVNAYNYLKKLIEKENYHFKTGILGGRVLFEVLSMFGDTALALELITKPTFPSYAYQINNGATTLWEGFLELKNGFEFKRKDGNERFLSLNHHFWGFITGWFYRNIAGLKFVSHNNVIIEPDFTLNSASCDRVINDKSISINWQKNIEKVKIEIICKNINGKLILPNNYVLNNGIKEQKLQEGSNIFIAIKK
jgi:alpha-L-rhamnosidase